MREDKDTAEAKRHEIQGLMAQALEGMPTEEARQLAAAAAGYFADIKAPKWEPPPMEMVTMHSGGRGGAVTTKPGNIVLNLGKLVRAIAAGALTIAGTMATPWTLLVGGLVTWDSLYSCLKLEINETQACVLWSLWQIRDDRHTVAKAEVFEAIQRERGAVDAPPLSQHEIDYALEELVKMRCIRQSSKDPERWWLREWVRVKY